MEIIRSLQKKWMRDQKQKFNLWKQCNLGSICKILVILTCSHWSLLVLHIYKYKPPSNWKQACNIYLFFNGKFDKFSEQITESMHSIRWSWWCNFIAYSLGFFAIHCCCWWSGYHLIQSFIKKFFHFVDYIQYIYFIWFINAEYT